MSSRSTRGEPQRMYVSTRTIVYLISKLLTSQRVRVSTRTEGTKVNYLLYIRNV